ncbi:MAG: ABC transporter substrate-binding protein [Pseudomonadota bacterium]|nr:ABC transporter substrate-binding protein [Pseudomonadota bacterium]
MTGTPLAKRRAALRAGAALALAAALPARAQAAPRLVTLGGPITEAVYLLGAQDLLVGTDTTSTYPDAAQRTPKVGYFRQLSAEGLLALEPTAIVANAEAGPPLVLEQLRGAGVRVDVVPVTHDWAEVQAKLAAVGRATGREAAAREVQARLDADWQAAQAEVANALARQPRRPRALFILGHGTSPSVAGAGTGADALIRLIGCDNAMQGYRGYRAMTAEGMAQAAPDVLLTTTEGIAAQGGIERLWARPGMALVPAYAARRLVARDALEMMGFGPRLPQTVRALHRAVVRGA